MANQPKKMGRRPTGKITVQVRMAESTKRELERWALKDNKSLSEYTEVVLLRHFKVRRAVKARLKKSGAR
ncbi:MAG: hypothetical protein WB586_21675 [Chthoniobacterales bacterium]